MKIHNCISLCTKKDAYVWSNATDRIVQHIDAENYTLIVPSQYVNLFKKISNPKFNVVDEQLFAPEFSLQYVKSVMPEHTRGKAGWYYQQLLKIKALSQSKNGADINVIWDADTIPLTKIDFIHNNKLVYYTSTEHHTPYFICTKKLMDLEKLVNFSFIAQNFAAKSIWVNEFLSMLSNKFQVSWFDAVLSNIDFEVHSGFSEYETLGTYFVHNYSDEMLIDRRFWKRHGSEICHIEDLDLYELCRMPNKPLFIGYEIWKSPSEFHQKAVHVDDDLLADIIKEKKQSQKWQRFEHFSKNIRGGAFDNCTENGLHNHKVVEYQPILNALL